MLYKQSYNKVIQGQNFSQDGIIYFNCGNGSNFKRFICHYISNSGKRYSIQYTFVSKYLRFDRKMREYIIKNNKEIYI